jgi:hypothetical protein
MKNDQAISDSPSVRDIAEFYRLALWSSDATCMEVASWIESLVASSEIVTPWLADLSTKMTSDVASMIDVLDIVPGIQTGSLPIRMFLGRIYMRMKSDLISGHQACMKIWAIFRDDEVPGFILKLRQCQDFSLDYQRPGFFRSEQDSKDHHLRILKSFERYNFAPSEGR